MSKTAEKQAQQDRALDILRETFPNGSVVCTALGHVSRSGMQRQFKVLHGNADGTVEDLSWAVARALGWSLGDRGVKVNGAGMDMGFHLVYTLAHALYGDGYALGYRLI